MSTPWRFGARRSVTASAVAAMALLAAVYGSSAGASSKQPPNGPLLGIVTAPSIGATGAPVGEAFTFSPDTHQIVAILPIGKISHSEKLRVAWSSLDAAGSPTVLFHQTIRVSSFTNAYSTAVVTGTLAVGNYEVTATLGSEHTSADWSVTPASPSTTSALLPPGIAVGTPSGQTGTASTTNLDPVLDAAGAGPLTPGPDGTANPLPPSPPPASASSQNGACQDFLTAGEAILTDFEAQAHGWHCDSAITLKAAENGAPLAVIATAEPKGKYGFADAETTVPLCSLPGHSETPGTTIRLVAEQAGHPEATEHFETTLEDSMSPGIYITGNASPAPGTKVSAGQRIDVSIIAAPIPPTYGLDYIEIKTNTGADTKARAAPGSGCGILGEARKTHFFDTIPPNPPPFYTVTMTAYEKGGRSTTGPELSWPTGNEWTGTAHYSSSETGQCTSTDDVSTTLDLVVAGNDTFAGTATLTYNATRACGDLDTTQMKTFPVTGLVTGGQFHFDSNNIVLFYPTVVVVPITGSTATAQFNGALPLGSWTASVNLTCKTC